VYIEFVYEGKKYSCDTSQGTDISMAVTANNPSVNCYYGDSARFETIKAGNFVGSIKEGGTVNHRKITFIPHANGTHTECYGHIAPENISVNQVLKKELFFALLISITPEIKDNNDSVIRLSAVKEKIFNLACEALIIRTLPNEKTKQTIDYSGTNPTYFEPEVCQYLVEQKIEHLLTDLPSLDRENDEGKLLAHRAFWQYPENIRKEATITELIFVPNHLPDGFYLLNLMIAPFENDATPSKPILYPLNK
jgi:kynurenine formamidase